MLHETKLQKERALIVGLDTTGDPFFHDSLDELAALAEACDIEPVGTVTQNLPKVDPRHYIGSGKVEEVKQLIDAEEIDVVIFDDELSPAHQRNLGDLLGVEVLDRTRLILEIFGRRAQTKEAQLQVELANLQYMLPRLRNETQDFDRQRGGGQANRGAGETQTSRNRRKVESVISEIKKELREVANQRETRKSRRQASNTPLVALVGYTNAGKSTVMNYMVKTYQEDDEKLVFEKDMLFATLDTYVRDITFDDGKKILLSDTVGFINKLPHHLVNAFHSTLEEVKDADLLLHVVDASNPNYEQHLNVTNETLKKMKADHIPQFVLYNKSDLIDDPIIEGSGNNLSISAKTGAGFNQLKDLIKRTLFATHQEVMLSIPHQDTNILENIKRVANILNLEYVATGILLQVELSEEDLIRYNKYIIEPGSEHHE